MSLPTSKERLDILRHYTAGFKLNFRDEPLIPVAALTSGCSGAELKGLCREAAMKAIRRGYPVGSPQYSDCVKTALVDGAQGSNLNTTSRHGQQLRSTEIVRQ